ncbi:MAG: ABC transporter ATP-binding protein [Actinobacteria bacterium]|nr:ABC transporter ATP-binding protein [Actinomycetota bacterium]MCI0544451.1 ABC transporter ATP-binding protein [Actinomycetota bacterium]MCI0679081.1 ABC transporter ATP-binding protein [Actinomycetota bacterium]
MSLVELSQATKTYMGPPSTEVLSRCDLTVEKGEFVTIRGRSGSGKSTLLNAIGLLTELDGGSYNLQGVDTRSMRETERDRLRGEVFGFVFQSFHLDSTRTALANVISGMRFQHAIPRRTRKATAVAALERVGLFHRSTWLAGRLSGGEKQRVALARAISSHPSILLCDEPTGNLDSDTARDILGLIRSIHRDGATVVLVSHEPAELVGDCVVYEMVRGRLVRES